MHGAWSCSPWGEQLGVPDKCVVMHEEWAELAAWQRELYRDVMMDNYELVASLGSAGPKPEVICQIERGEEPHVGAPQGERDGGIPEAPGVEAWGQHGEETLLEEEPSPRWLLLPGGTQELASDYAPLCPSWCDMKHQDWVGDMPQTPPALDRGFRTFPDGASALGPAAAGSKEILICGACGRSFEDAAALSTHLCQPAEHPVEAHVCQACGKVFRHRRNLLTHKKRRGQRRHACTECARSFCLKGDLLRHRAGHAGAGGYGCGLCGQSFRHKRHLLAHKKEHVAGRALYQCPGCSESFRDVAELAGHRAAHCEERPFACPRCDRRFSWKESLLIHQRSHAQERSHRCPDCGRGFSRSGNLRAHQRVHTGERPFACPECDRTFCNKANLVAHQKLHRRCRASFSAKGKLLLPQEEHGDGAGPQGTG
ncbi:zinc finger protein 436-like [Alligator mississippiensis]|uniref:Zinc finger protein 436-like n=1 Tax=Alligator mississippiensis TaxID=8496 RepID=A0A151NTU8_ALLMI|nr:zinc finger protein 436-like [Alligator mississippiensis]